MEVVEEEGRGSDSMLFKLFKKEKGQSVVALLLLPAKLDIFGVKAPPREGYSWRSAPLNINTSAPTLL